MVSYWVRYLSLGLGSGWASIGLIDGYLGLGLDFGLWVWLSLYCVCLGFVGCGVGLSVWY